MLHYFLKKKEFPHNVNEKLSMIILKGVAYTPWLQKCLGSLLLVISIFLCEVIWAFHFLRNSLFPFKRLIRDI